MKLVPLLALQRSLYNVPIETRFPTYLDTMLLENRQDLRYPLGNMNPMAKPHVPQLLDEYLDLNADEVAAKLVHRHRTSSSSSNNDLSLGLVLADDALGGWTDRIDVEFKSTFARQALLKRGWVEALLWSSDVPATLAKVELAVELALHQTEYGLVHTGDGGDVGTLKDMLDQEAWVWTKIGCQEKKVLSPKEAGQQEAEVKSALETLKLHQEASIDDDYPSIVAAYFGDEAAEARGHPGLGMKKWNGQEICKAGLWN